MNSEQQEALRVQKEEHELLVQSHDSELKSLESQMAQSGRHHDSCAYYMDQIKQSVQDFVRSADGAREGEAQHL